MMAMMAIAVLVEEVLPPETPCVAVVGVMRVGHQIVTSPSHSVAELAMVPLLTMALALALALALVVVMVVVVAVVMVTVAVLVEVVGLTALAPYLHPVMAPSAVACMVVRAVSTLAVWLVASILVGPHVGRVA